MDSYALYQQAQTAYLARIKRNFHTALTYSMVWVIILGAVFFAQDRLFDTADFALVPQNIPRLWSVLSAPLLHGSIEHLVSNALAIIVLGTLAGSLYPRASLFSLPIIWLGSGLGTWFISIGGHHIGASGITVGLMFFLIAQGARRRDRVALSVLLLALFFFGGMVLSFLPQEPGVSWEYHFSGAVCGFLCGFMFSRLDPQAPQRLYSWDIEEPLEHTASETELEPPSPSDVPIIWPRSEPQAPNVLPFRRPPD